jgi:trans-2,3-dihydro-3-hydroxyanthranilate isomerase
MTRNYRFLTCDVFTETRFGGNQLAVLPDGHGLSDSEMQSIAKEFNFSETTFLLPPTDAKHTARVRIFTPGGELPFAGHPTVGTAFVLATIGVIPRNVSNIVFEEGVGPVPVRIERDGDRVTTCTLTAARLPEQGPPAPPREGLAQMLRLADADVLDGAECWSCGVPYLVVPLAKIDALAGCALDLPVWREVLGGYTTQKVYPVARAGEGEWRVRMFAPSVGVPEDPATGSAAASFAGWLCKRNALSEGTLRFTLRQGFEVGRPSELRLEIDRAAGATTAVRVGGASVMVSEGMLFL